MNPDTCDVQGQFGHFFDITHSFKSGSSTYHVLGARKDHPSYRNTYYVFNCVNHAQEPKTSPLLKNRSRVSHNSTANSLDDADAEQTPKTKSQSAPQRARTESPSKAELDTTAIRDMFIKTMRTERHAIVTSLRKEMNIKKKGIIRTIKKENKTLLEATAEANKNEQIIRLLEEQKSLLTDTYEKCAAATAASMDALKQSLIETLDTQHEALRSMEQLQMNLMQTIEGEVKKIALKNEEIRALTVEEKTAIAKLETTLGQKIDNASVSKRNEAAELNRRFEEQKKVLSDAVAQHQQSLSLDLIKQTFVNVLQEQQAAVVKAQGPQAAETDLGHLSSEKSTSQSRRAPARQSSSHAPRLLDSSSTRTTSKAQIDQHLLKVSIRSPEPAQLFAKLLVDGMEYSRRLYTLCQRDVLQPDIYNCYIAPPTKDGLYELTLYAKTKKQTSYRAAMTIRLPGSDRSPPSTLPLVHQAFEERQCILIEPLQRLLRSNEPVLIHMVVPEAQTVRIRNGSETIELNGTEYKNGVVKKKIRVRGDVHVLACWEKKSETTVCVFNVLWSIQLLF